MIQVPDFVYVNVMRPWKGYLVIPSQRVKVETFYTPVNTEQHFEHP